LTITLRMAHVSDGQQAFVEQQEHAEEEEGHAEAGQTHADLCKEDKLVNLANNEPLLRKEKEKVFIN